MENKKPEIQEFRTPEFIAQAQSVLSAEEYGSMKVYIESGGQALSPSTASNMFNLFLNGSSLQEIWKLNRQIALGSIIEAAVKFNWHTEKVQYSQDLHGKIREKVVQSQLQATELLTDMLTVANKQHSEKLKRYIQSGNLEDLEGSMNIENLTALLRTIDGLREITNQNKAKDAKAMVDINVIQAGTRDITAAADVKQLGSKGTEKFTPEQAKSILKMISENKSKAK